MGHWRLGLIYPLVALLPSLFGQSPFLSGAAPNPSNGDLVFSEEMARGGVAGVFKDSLMNGLVQGRIRES